MALNRYKCLTGWLLAPSPTDDKTDVPFFVQVRGKDIHNKKEDVFDVDLLERVEGLEVEECYGECYLKLKVNGWDVKVFNSGLYEAKLDLDFSDNDLELRDNGSVLSKRISLPFITDKTNDIFTTISVNSSLDELSAVIGTTKFEDPYKEYLKTITITLRNLLSKFDSNFKENDNYKNSHAYIIMTGRVCIDVHFVG